MKPECLSDIPLDAELLAAVSLDLPPVVVERLREMLERRHRACLDSRAGLVRPAQAPRVRPVILTLEQTHLRDAALEAYYRALRSKYFGVAAGVA